MNKTVVVMELTAEFLTVVEVKGGVKHADLVRFAVQKLPETGFSADWLRQFWQQEQISQNQVICILPNRFVRYKSVTLPVLPDNQLENAVQMEIDGNGSGDDCFQIMSKSVQDTMMTVKVATIRNKDLFNFQTPLRDAGLEVLWLGYHARGVQNFINFHKGFLHDRSPEVAYITFNEKRAEFGVVNDTAVIYRRDLEIGMAEFQGPDLKAAETDLIEELRLSTAAFQAGNGKEPPRVLWLFGKDLKGLIQLEKFLAEKGYEVSLQNNSRLGGTPSREATPALAPLLGLALDDLGWDTQEQLRIYTQEQRQKQSIKGHLKVVGKFAVAGCILAGGLLLMMQAQLIKREKNNEWLVGQSAKILELRRVDAESNQYLAKVKAMEKWSDLRGLELEYLMALQEGLPEDTTITDLSFEDGQLKTVAGITPSVSLLLSKIQKSPVLRILKLKGNIAVTETGLERFQLEGLTKEKETE